MAKDLWKTVQYQSAHHYIAAINKKAEQQMQSVKHEQQSIPKLNVQTSVPFSGQTISSPQTQSNVLTEENDEKVEDDKMTILLGKLFEKIEAIEKRQERLDSSVEDDEYSYYDQGVSSFQPVQIKITTKDLVTWSRDDEMTKGLISSKLNQVHHRQLIDESMTAYEL